MLRGFTFGIVAIVLTACETTQTADVQAVRPKSTAIAVSADAQPGPNLVTTKHAISAFEELCLKQLPKFAGTQKAAIAMGGFVQHKKFGTYYHQRDNLSVKLIYDGCSMVFGTKDDAKSVKDRFTALALAYAKNIEIKNDALGGPILFRAFIKQN